VKSISNTVVVVKINPNMLNDGQLLVMKKYPSITSDRTKEKNWMHCSQRNNEMLILCVHETIGMFLLMNVINLTG